MVTAPRTIGPGATLEADVLEAARKLSTATRRLQTYRRRVKRLERAFTVAKYHQNWARTNAIAAAYARLTNGGKL